MNDSTIEAGVTVDVGWGTGILSATRLSCAMRSGSWLSKTRRPYPVLKNSGPLMR